MNELIEVSNIQESSEDNVPLMPNLTSEELLVAYGEATKRFRTLDELRIWSKRSPSWFWKLRGRPEYQDQVRAILQVIANQMVRAAGGIAEAFNQEILPSIATLREIRDNAFEKAGDRIKASTVLIDHAPEAPRAGSAVDDSRTLRISFPVQQIKNLEKALLDEDEGDLVELLKGRDFDEVPNEGEEGFKVPVKDLSDFE